MAATAVRMARATSSGRVTSGGTNNTIRASTVSSQDRASMARA